MDFPSITSSLVLSLVGAAISLLVGIMIIDDITIMLNEEPIIETLPLLLPVLNAQQPLATMNLLAPYMESYDILAYDSANYTVLQPSFPATLHATGGANLTSLLDGMCFVPSDTTIITYNYEPGVTVGYTNNQTIAASYFNALRNEAHSCGKQLAITPVFLYTSNWNWFYISQYTDIIVLQMQNFQQGADPDNFPPGSMPDELGTNMTAVMTYMVGVVPEPTKLYVQLDTLGPTSPQIISDYYLVRDLGVDGVAIWYNPTLSQGTMNIEPLIETLEVLRDPEPIIPESSRAVNTIWSVVGTIPIVMFFSLFTLFKKSGRD